VLGPEVSFVIFVAPIDSVGPMIDIDVGIGGRVNQGLPKDCLWLSNPTPLRVMTIH